MDFTTALTLIGTGVAAPFITALFTRKDMPAHVKSGITMVVCIILGSVAAVGTGAIAEVPANVVEWVIRVVVTIGIITALSQTYYRMFKGAVKQVEDTTTKRTPPTDSDPDPHLGEIDHETAEDGSGSSGKRYPGPSLSPRVAFVRGAVLATVLAAILSVGGALPAEAASCWSKKVGLSGMGWCNTPAYKVWISCWSPLEGTRTYHSPRTTSGSAVVRCPWHSVAAYTTYAYPVR